MFVILHSLCSLDTFFIKQGKGGEEWVKPLFSCVKVPMPYADTTRYSCIQINTTIWILTCIKIAHKWSVIYKTNYNQTFKRSICYRCKNAFLNWWLYLQLLFIIRLINYQTTDIMTTTPTMSIYFNCKGPSHHIKLIEV